MSKTCEIVDHVKMTLLVLAQLLGVMNHLTIPITYYQSIASKSLKVSYISPYIPITVKADTQHAARMLFNRISKCSMFRLASTLIRAITINLVASVLPAVRIKTIEYTPALAKQSHPLHIRRRLWPMIMYIRIVGNWFITGENKSRGRECRLNWIRSTMSSHRL